MRDDAALPTKEHTRAQEMKNRVERLMRASWPHVISILILDKTRDLANPSQCVVDQGSGILLRTDQRRFILTARHVVGKLPGRDANRGARYAEWATAVRHDGVDHHRRVRGS